MENLSRNFSEWEFRCHCGCGEVLVDPRLVEALQLLRDKIGHPITVISGYRCFFHNRDVGGVSDSQHLLGRAADVVVKGLEPETVATVAEDIPEFKHGGIGRYDDFTHLDVRQDGSARWDEGKEKSHV